jgi:hypothetical protein
MAMKRLFLWLVMSVLATSALAAATTQLPFIHDDYAKARAQALQQKLPIFVECWAPW